MSTCSPPPVQTFKHDITIQESYASLRNFNLNANLENSKMLNICKNNSSVNVENQRRWKNPVFEENKLFHEIDKKNLWDDRKLFQNFTKNGKAEGSRKKFNVSNINNSTLSLHISAYENAIGEDNEFSKLEGMKQNFSSNLSNASAATLEFFEIPRGNENEPKVPEIMQFKASQKLLDVNKLTPVPQQQVIPFPATTVIPTPKNIDGIGAKSDKMLDAPTTPQKPLKKRANVTLVDDLTKCSKIDVDDYIKKLMTCADANGNITDYLTDPAIIEQICVLAIDNLSKMPSMLELSPKINIVGDIHGQFLDLLRIFKLCGPPDCTKYLFLGDYVDRGPNSLEVICLLLLLRVRYPDTFFLLRGNHECSNINRVYGFLHECEDRFQRIPILGTIWGIDVSDLKGTQVWYRFQDVFNWLPMTALIGKKILCMHGGLSPDLVSLDQLRKLARPIDPESAGIHIDLLWADPDGALPNGDNDSDWGPSARGISSHFNVKAVNNACKTLGLDMIVRGHQVVQDGYEFFANRKLVTIFSAPNYCGDYNNSGAIMTIESNLETSFHIIKPLANIKKKSKATEVDFDDIDLDSLMAEGSAETI